MDVTSKKTLWIWGKDATSVKDSPNNKTDEHAAASVSVLQLEEVAIDKFAIGKSCCALVSREKKCYQVGQPGSIADLSPSQIESTLCEIPTLSPLCVMEVSCGYRHVAVVTDAGKAFCWGISNYGQCGVVTELVSEPRAIEHGRNGENLSFKNVACGKNHTMAVSTDHELWGWGLSHMIGGTSATKRNMPRHKPELVECLRGRRVIQVDCGKFHTVALTEKVMKKPALLPDSPNVCSICNQETYRMYDNEDQVIITDTHVCSANTTVESHSMKRYKTHNRSSSLPFLKRKSPSLGRRERLSQTPPSLPRLSLAVANSSSSESLRNISGIKEGKIELELAPRSSFSEQSSKRKDVLPTNVKSETMDGKSNDKEYQPCSLSKSRSTPADLGKQLEMNSSETPHFPCKLLTDDSSYCSNSSPGSTSPSLTSLEECKSRMTLPISSVISVDTESAMAYLKQLSPDESGTTKSYQLRATETIAESADENTDADHQPGNEKPVSLSERISLSLAENQLLSPITSYSKNVFTGVMDQIEWIKASAYDKGVAPIREFLSKDKAQTKSEEKDEGHSATSHDDPLRAMTTSSNQDGFDGDCDRLTLHTEVWTWGKNSYGQLGLADLLDRFQPSCVNTLGYRGIVKISCGAKHTVVLTSNSEVYAWGCNKDGQLGHNDSNTRSPTKVECSQRVWDVSAGKHHTLFLVDGVAQEATILVCGSDSGTHARSPHPLNFSKKKASCWKLRPLDFSHKMGFHYKVISGFSMMSSCISEWDPSNVTIALHNFAKSERGFYRQITLLKTEILHPLKFSDLFVHLEASPPYGSILSQSLELFGRLSYNVGLNTVQLNSAINDGAKCEEKTFSRVSNLLIHTYEQYFKLVNEMIAYGFFEKCEELSAKQCKFLLKSKTTEIFKMVLGEKRISKLPSENFVQAFQMPAFRLREYSAALSKLAIALEENILLSSFLRELSAKWNESWNEINNRLKSANNTRGFWKTEFKSGKLSKIAASLKKLGRYLVIHSRKVPLDIADSGRFSSNWIVLFSDCLVLVQNSTHTVYSLETLWCSPVADADSKRHNISISSPEDELLLSAPTDDSKSTWMTSLNRTINLALSKSETGHTLTRDTKQHHRSPPSSRHATYTFTKGPDFKGAIYTGGWLGGKPHGKGKMAWEDGRIFVGCFKNGKEDGYGEWKAAHGDTSKLKYQGWWRDGKMDGYGKLWYSEHRAYEGAFIAGLREGHGILRSGSVTEGFVYVGAWKNDRRCGFGVEDNITKGDKYLGMWAADERHGVGILVTLDGLYGQSCFSHGNMSGDTLLIEDRHVFEGHISLGLVLNGKGRLTLPTGDKLEGTFSGAWSDRIRISGNFLRLDHNHSVNRPESPKTPIEPAPSLTHLPYKDHTRTILRRYNRHIMKKRQAVGNGVKIFPLTLHPDSKWTEIFFKCRCSLKCQSKDTGGSEAPVAIARIWEALSVAISHAKQMREESKLSRLSPQKKIDEKKLSWLEKVPSLVGDGEKVLTSDDIQCIKDYLAQAFSTTLHPLGELAESLGDVYRDSYSGAGAHKWLLSQAIADVRSFVRRTYDIIRFLFPHLGKDHNASHMKILRNHNDENELDVTSTAGDVVVTAGDLLLPVLLPRVYPTLFTLYALRYEIEDGSYWERVTRLNRHPDIALLSFLGVKPKFWLLDDKEIPPLETSPESGQLYESVEQAESSKWRHLLVARAKDCSFLSAIETLQLISTTFIPAEKLNVIQSTFKEINATVLKYYKQPHTWSMDDLFPVFQYVVIRARISHLGCEIQLIEDFLEPDLCKGEKGIMFTTLKACYFQIRVEKYL